MAGQTVVITLNRGEPEHYHQFEQVKHPGTHWVYAICRGCGYTARIR